MQRADLSRIYAAQRLGPTKSTKGKVHRGGAPCFKKHKQEVAAKKFKRKASPPVALRATQIKTHVDTPYEAFQLENRNLQEKIITLKMQHRGWINTLLTLLSEPTPDLDFVKTVLSSELKRARK